MVNVYYVMKHGSAVCSLSGCILVTFGQCRESREMMKTNEQTNVMLVMILSEQYSV